MWQDFLTKFNGQQGVGNTPENKGQCTGLCNVYIVDYLKKSFIWGDAKDWIYNYNFNDFDFIPNTPDYIPQQGDIIVKSGGTYGHVAIATGTGDLHKYEVFEQNVPLGGGCRLHTYEDEYKNVLGGLRIKQDTQSIIIQQSDAFIAICTKLGLPADRDIVLLNVEKFLGYEQKLLEQGKQLEEAQKKANELGKTIEEDKGKYEKLQKDADELSKKANEAVLKNDELSKRVEQLEKDCKPAPVYVGWRKMIIDFISKL